MLKIFFFSYSKSNANGHENSTTVGIGQRFIGCYNKVNMGTED